MWRRVLKTVPWLVAFALGAVGRLFWQPKSALADASAPGAGAGVTVVEESAAGDKPGGPRKPAVAPGGVPSELWSLLQTRPAGGDWGRLIEAAHPTEKDVLLAAWVEADPMAAARWSFATLGKGRNYMAIIKLFGRDPELGWKITKDTGSPLAANSLTSNMKALAEHPEIIRQALAWKRYHLAPALANSLRNADASTLSALAASAPDLMVKLCLNGVDTNLIKKWAELDASAYDRVRAVATPAQKMQLDLLEHTERVPPKPQSPGPQPARELTAAEQALRARLEPSAKNPAELAAAVGKERVADVPASVFTHTAARWVVDDPVAASQWVSALPAGPVRDAGITGMVRSLMGEPAPPNGSFLTGGNPIWEVRDRSAPMDLDGALAWSATLSDSDARTTMTLEAARRLLDRDAAGAASALQSTAMPDDLRAAVRAELGLQP